MSRINIPANYEGADRRELPKPSVEERIKLLEEKLDKIDGRLKTTEQKLKVGVK